MRYFLVLKGNNKDLATKEFETLFEVYYKERISLIQAQNTIYCFESRKKLKISDVIFRRLTFTNFLGVELSCHDSFDDYCRDFPKDRIKEFEGKSFVVRTRKAKRDLGAFYEPAELAKPIWDSFDNPRVDIGGADVEFSFVFYDDNKIHFTRKLYENEKDYLRRMPKLRPVVKPYTLKADMARAAINFLGLKSGVVLDPFCGIGGILLEAYDLGFEVVGNDINWNDLKSFKVNFEYFFPDSKYVRILADSKTQFLKDNSVDGIVTDVPYGKSSRKLGVDLYEEFFKSAKKYLKNGSRLVVIYANFVDLRELALKYFEEVFEIEEYINASMTRYVLVLKNSKK